MAIKYFTGLYPKEFSSSAVNAVEAEHIRAGQDFDRAISDGLPKWHFDHKEFGGKSGIGPPLSEYVLRVRLAFVKQACKFGQQGIWTIAEIRKAARTFLSRFTLYAHKEKVPWLRATTFNEGDGLMDWFEDELRKSTRWQEHEDLLLSVADIQSEATLAHPKVVAASAPGPDLIVPEPPADTGDVIPGWKPTILGNEAPPMNDDVWSAWSEEVDRQQKQAATGSAPALAGNPTPATVTAHPGQDKPQQKRSGKQAVVNAFELVKQEIRVLGDGWVAAPVPSPQATNSMPPTESAQPDSSTVANEPSSAAGTLRTYSRLQALKFALRKVFQEGQTTPLKSWEEVREELLLIANDERVPIELRTKVRDELNPPDDAVKSALTSTSSEAHKEVGKIIIDRILEPSEATQFRRSPEYRDRVMREAYLAETAQAFDDIERDDPAFFSYIIETAHRANNAKLRQPATTKVSLNREEQHELLRKFSAEHLGLSDQQLVLVLRRDEWKLGFLAWLTKQDLRLRGPRGAPKKLVAEMTRAEWRKLGEPKLTAEVRDQLAELGYPKEFARAKVYSKERKRLRDRVAKQVRLIVKKASPTSAAT